MEKTLTESQPVTNNTESAAPVAPAENAPEAKAPPVISYELKKPEGYEFSDSRLDEIASYARERGLSAEAAQELVEREHSALQSWKTAETEKFTQARQQWIKELREDKTYGGDNFTKTVELAKRGLERVGTPALKDLLNRTGYGDHKELVITFARIGEMLAEDSLITRTASTQNSKPRTIEEIFYGGKQE